MTDLVGTNGVSKPSLLDRMRYIADTLDKWAKGETPTHQGLGICGSITNLKINVSGDVLVYSYSQEWPHFSGDVSYPIPHPTSKYYQTEAYHELDKWSDTVYGNMRRELCGYIATRIREDYKL